MMASLVLFNKAGIAGRQLTVYFSRVAGSHVGQKRDSSKLTSIKRGRGGRSSFSGTVATVFGANGFLGNCIVNGLGKMGSQVIIPYRGDTYDVDPLKLCGDLGQILFSPFHLEDEDSIRTAMKYSNVVINLIGRNYETKNFSYKDVHVDGARRIARIARECGIQKLIHVSALNASPTPQKTFRKTGPEFFRTKYKGELAVREEFPEAVIIRPAPIFGKGDKFMYEYVSVTRRRKFLRMLPLWKGGEATVKQPVYVLNVTEGILQAALNPDANGKTFEFVGPHRYYLSDLCNYFMQIIVDNPSYSMSVSKLKFISYFWLFRVNFLNKYLWFGSYTADKIDIDHVTDHVTGCPTLEDLGVKLTRIEDVAEYELDQFRTRAYHLHSLESRVAIPKPQTVALE